MDSKLPHRSRHCIVLSAFLLLVLITANASATIYTFVDEKGVVHMTNVPTASRLWRNSQSTLKSKKKKAPHSSIESYINEAAKRYNVDPLLVRAVIKVESNFDHWAISKKGAMGLMQLMPETANDMRVRFPFNPRANIMGGTCYLGKLLSRFNGNLTLGLAAYNAGPTRVAMAKNTVPQLPETIHYIEKVMHHYQLYLNNKVSKNRLSKI